MYHVSKVLIVSGLILLLVGIIFYITSQLGFDKIIPLGKLPGDIRYQREGFTCLVPIVSSILLSIVLTALLNLVIHLLNRR